MKAFAVDLEAPLGVKLRHLERPMSGPGRAVVEVHAVSLNRGEILHVQKYRLLPAGSIPGWDLAGVVADAATDGSGPRVGTPVFGWSASRGTWAEQVAVDVDHLEAAPPDLSMDDASTLGVAALTAYAALGHGPRPLVGAQVVVTGATGGVGSFALQLALLSGAATTAVVRAGTDPQAVGDVLPAGVAIEIGLDPDGVPADLVVESVGGDMLSAALRRVARRGTVVTLGRTTDSDAVIAPAWFQKHAQLHGLVFAQDYGTPGSTATALRQLGQLVVSGHLRTNITAVLDAHDLEHAMSMVLDRRVTGKAVVRWR